ncbi:hypothetical protein ILUMI_08966 [Ignelater luminosus]|uniref:DnaJ homologue subfamily C member 28 conserved domain-containing protein n=1 Tax=Ignelater luminosus TaxID=2038154 RepID=A0A8K0D570_IGNLU|nr:hypothetical protein ILUMI_08966 [Ignelater luminosus]
MERESQKTQKARNMYGFDRLVEDLIQEAISKGKFDNLSGNGKPLSEIHSKNPYVDYVTHKLNEILIENGFTPEWITLQKEIRDDIQVFRNTLQFERINFPPYPLSIEENIKWSNAVYKHKDLVDAVNTKINKYNLLVPILQRQMLLVSLPKEAQKVLLKGKSNKDIINGHRTQEERTNTEKEAAEPANFLGLFQLFFRKSE